jgi:exonuclease SbcC
VVLIRDALARLRRLEAAGRALATARGAAERAAAECAARLAAAGFADAEAARAAALDDDTLALAGARIRAADDERAAAQAVLAEPEVAAAPAAPVDPAPAISAAEQARSALEAASAESGRLRGLADDVAATAARAIALLARTEAQQQQYRAIRDLAATVHGDEPNTRRMRLETYVLAAQLEQILAAANLRLQRMTSGRYSLDLDDERQHRNVETGLGIGVRDAHTGQVRQAVSLSGGEMFLASLALALGLAEVVSAESGGVSLDTLFVDEGFGSLDGETLDVAMAALDDLRAGGRTIGLISHVESMQERIPAKLAVEVLPGGDSRIVQGVPVTV